MLKTVLETIEGVDDALKPFYAEAEGKYVLQVEGIDAHPEVSNLKNAYERTKADKATAAQKLKDMETRLSELGKDRPDEAKLAEERKRLEDQISEWKTKATDLEGKLTGVTRDRALMDALTASGVTNPTFVKAAQRLLADQVRMDGEHPMVDTGMGPKSLADFVKQWAAGEGKDFVTPSAGGGAKGTEAGSKSGPRTMTRDQFDALPVLEKAAASKEGVRLTD